MSYKPKSLFQVIENINREIYLPHIQRPFVWEIDQMEKLFDSLMRGYPIQTFLFWRTKEEIKVRKFMDIIDTEANLSDFYDKSKSGSGAEKVFVLDGQQRLQSLYCLYNGRLKDYYSGSCLEAYVDITSSNVNEETGLIFKLNFQPENENQPLPLFRIKDLMSKYAQKNAEEISEEINEGLDALLNENTDEKKRRERQVRRNIGQMVSILREDKFFWIEELDGVANEYPYKQILEIFVRVNSGGTKLFPSDLMFAAMKEISPSIEENIEKITDELQVEDIQFDVNFVLKCLLIVNDKQVEVSPEKFSGPEGQKLIQEIDKNWAKYENAFQALRDFIVGDLKLYSAKVIRSYLAFVPIFEYFYHNNAPTPQNKKLLKAYYYRSQLFNWYSSRTDGTLDYLHNNYLKEIGRSDFPLTNISSYFSEKRNYTIKVDKSWVEYHPLRFILLNLLYVEITGTSAFNVKLKNNEPHIDHIYPKSQLYNYDFETADINHIGNYRFLGATDNIRKRAELPDSYFKRLKDDGIDIKRHLLVDEYSDDPIKLLMDEETYLDFRNKRSERVLEIVQNVVNV